MIQGTGSHVGKTLMAAGLCRAFRRRGLKVAPFKPQNMANNAAATADGGEIGRAQALQARAAGLPLTVHMNPVLLKPENETGAQVVLQGKRIGSWKAADYARLKAGFLPKVMESFEHMCEGTDLVIVEGAGSPAETNLREGDIANMGFAEAAGVPVLLVGDIERGGVIANLAGTHRVLSESDRSRIRGFIVNKFRGDPALFAEGVTRIEAETGWPCFGVVPWFAEAARLPAEDSQGMLDSSPRKEGALKIAVPILPRTANFDDLNPLRAEPGVELTLVRPGEAMPVADLILVIGSKSTISDLAALREEGWDIDIEAHRRRGGPILGICGGYQMLGKRIADPEGIEGPPEEVPGLGYLDIETVMTRSKKTGPVEGRHLASGEPVNGYEIHSGVSDGPGQARPFAVIEGKPDGAISPDGRIAGTYLHGVFDGDEFRRAYLASLGAKPSDLAYGDYVDGILDRLADHLERHLDLDHILATARAARL